MLLSDRTKTRTLAIRHRAHFPNHSTLLPKTAGRPSGCKSKPQRRQHLWGLHAPRLSPQQLRGARGGGEGGPPATEFPEATQRERRDLLTDNLFHGWLLIFWWRFICPSVVKISSHCPRAMKLALHGGDATLSANVGIQTARHHEIATQLIQNPES